MSLVNWRALYVDPAHRNDPEFARSDMRYGATRQGAQVLDEHLQPQEERQTMTHDEGLHYIAQRRGAMAYREEKKDQAIETVYGDGLFNAAGKADLEAECRRFDSCPDSIEWRAILSFRKEDLERSEYFSPRALQQLLSAKMPAIGKLHNISPENLVWNAAFHPVDKYGRDHHPHVHVYFYSTDPTEGRVSQRATLHAFEKTRSMMVNTIFHDEMQAIQIMGQDARRTLHDAMRSLRLVPDWATQCGLMEDLRQLHGQLPDHGKPQYGYLPKGVKKTVDGIVAKVLEQPAMQEIYQQLEAAQRQYVEAYNDDPEKIELRMADWRRRFYHPTAQGDKAVFHNEIIKLASDFQEEMPGFTETVEEDMPRYIDSDRDRYIDKLIDAAEKGDAVAMYKLACTLQREDPEKSSVLFSEAAKRGVIGAIIKVGELEEKAGNYWEAARHYEQATFGNGVDAMYRLGRLYEKGGHGFPPDSGMAEMWLDKAASNHHLWAELRMAQRYAEDDPIKRDAYLQNAIMGLEWKAKETESDDPYLHKLLGQLYEQADQPINAIYEYTLAREDPQAAAALVRLSSDGETRAKLIQLSAEDDAVPTVLKILDIAGRWQSEAADASRRLLDTLQHGPLLLQRLDKITPGSAYYQLSDEDKRSVDLIVKSVCPTSSAYVDQRLRNVVLNAYTQHRLWNVYRSSADVRDRLTESTTTLRQLHRQKIDHQAPGFQRELHRASDTAADAHPLFKGVADRNSHQWQHFVSSVAEQEQRQQQTVDHSMRFAAIGILQTAAVMIEEAANRSEQRRRQTEKNDPKQIRRKKKDPEMRSEEREKPENEPGMEPL